jgi:hypothetical protein
LLALLAPRQNKAKMCPFIVIMPTAYGAQDILLD